MSSTTYSSALVFRVMAFLSNQASRRQLFSGNLSVGTNSSSQENLNIAASGSETYSGISSVLGLFCDNPLALSLDNGTQTIDTTVNSMTIVEGTFSSVVITNPSASNSVKATVIYA